MWILQSVPDVHLENPVTLRLLPGGAKTVGRAVRADFVVDAALVSRVHCRLVTNRDDRLEVEDLNSTNGTFVNERRVQRAMLAPGDILRVGRVEFVVSHDERPEPALE
jgi:pSer/pThr/pTyr-binding forkhead associated (FHA) protein